MPFQKNKGQLPSLKQWTLYPNVMASKQSKFIGLFVLALVLFNFPLLGIFSHSSSVGGIPTVFIYIFATWLGIIFFTRQNAESNSSKDKKKND